MPAPAVVPARATDRAAVLRLDALAAATVGRPKLGDAVRRDLDTPAAGTGGFVARSASGELAGYVHVGRGETGAADEWTVGLVVAPDPDEAAVVAALIEAALGHVAGRGGGRATLWIPEPGGAVAEAVRSCGFVAAREVVEMRVPLPLDESPAWPAGVTVRTFEPGRDDDPWLAVNNRAFAGHPEQGGWTREMLRRRMAEPWFDPSLFLLAFDERGLAGFDWLKVHDPHDGSERLGEIYVIGVDPDRQGSGLGRALAVAGLALVAERGVRIGMLYVAHDNAPALALYRDLGFTEHHRDRAYECRVDAARSAVP